MTNNMGVNGSSEMNVKARADIMSACVPFMPMYGVLCQACPNMECDTDDVLPASLLTVAAMTHTCKNKTNVFPVAQNKINTSEVAL